MTFGAARHGNALQAFGHGVQTDRRAAQKFYGPSVGRALGEAGSGCDAGGGRGVGQPEPCIGPESSTVSADFCSTQRLSSRFRLPGIRRRPRKAVFRGLHRHTRVPVGSRGAEHRTSAAARHMTEAE